VKAGGKQRYLHSIVSQKVDLFITTAVSTSNPTKRFRFYYVGVLISHWLSKAILFLQDNAAPHKAAITHQKFADLHFEVLKHPDLI
jgi:hypothetical protein